MSSRIRRSSMPTCQLVQHWSCNCSGFLRTPVFSQTHGARGGKTRRRSKFLGCGEPDIRAVQVQRWGKQLL